MLITLHISSVCCNIIQPLSISEIVIYSAVNIARQLYNVNAHLKYSCCCHWLDSESSSIGVHFSRPLDSFLDAYAMLHQSLAVSELDAHLDSLERTVVYVTQNT
jgi:hypothetical protein